MKNKSDGLLEVYEENIYIATYYGCVYGGDLVAYCINSGKSFYEKESIPVICKFQNEVECAMVEKIMKLIILTYLPPFIDFPLKSLYNYVCIK